MGKSLEAVLILGVIFGFLFAGRYLRHKQRMFEMQLRAEKEFSSELRLELDEIKERLAALEKIVTAKGYQVREEIDGL